ncbi:hypothetical protein PbB2_00091 [Candidatus Phycosocius bacilliformis]|uniref:Uncharacterized protein n=1 Tax=Candidatus Phycosocius bacilliformis TaxID=1445552 RepID=A0A2P2E5U4_9PROT|nr:hypothetical protein [Candidatus Phycosocius bacilliformis]GBF56435.1 hypothetical protein PbB2_00091 [Candidatus Phycosocius bacilliformis]
MSRMSSAAARILKASIAFDSIMATWLPQGVGPGQAVLLQVEAAPQEEASLMSTPIRHDRLNAAVLAADLVGALALHDLIQIAAPAAYAGSWRVDTVPRTVSDDDPYGLLVRFEACRA